MNRYILALDQGTTSSRSIVFDADGTPVATAQRELTQHFPASGWVEHDATEIWRTQSDTLHEALATAGITAHDLAAVGIANQRETTVLWDRRSGEPLGRAIVWQDRRTTDQCRLLRAAGHEREIARRTGLLLDPYFSGTKLAWMLEHIPQARARAEDGELCFGTIDSWLAWQLSGGRLHVTDVTNASRTLLLNLHTGDWDPWMLELLRIPRACLPELVASSRAGGATVRIGGAEVPLGGIAGDQQSALFGQCCFAPGMAKNTYGTGCFMLMNTGATPLLSQHRLLTTIAADSGGGRQYALEGSVFVGGAVVQWLRDGLGFFEHSADIEALAQSVPDHGGVYVVPAFTGLGSPHWDPFARGSIAGITRGTTRDAYARYSESGNDYIYNVQRLLKKFETAANLVPAPIVRAASQRTRMGVIYFGSTAPAMDEALEALSSDGVHLDAMRLRAFPFPQSVPDFIASHDVVFVVEQNRDAQMRTLLINELDVDPAKMVRVLHYDGTPITARFITQTIRTHAGRQAAASQRSDAKEAIK